jgi:hypothetical protein
MMLEPQYNILGSSLEIIPWSSLQKGRLKQVVMLGPHYKNNKREQWLELHYFEAPAIIMARARAKRQRLELGQKSKEK